jgi:hypothetical protein
MLVSTIHLNVAVAIEICVVSSILIWIDQGKQWEGMSMLFFIPIFILLLLCASSRGGSCCWEG